MYLYTGDARDMGWILGSRRSPGGKQGNTLRYSCLRIIWTEDPGRVQSTGSQRIGHDWSDLAHINIVQGNNLFCIIDFQIRPWGGCVQQCSFFITMYFSRKYYVPDPMMVAKAMTMNVIGTAYFLTASLKAVSKMLCPWHCVTTHSCPPTISISLFFCF